AGPRAAGGRRGGGWAQERGRATEVGGLVEPPRAPAGTPAHVARHGLAGAHLPAQRRIHLGALAHVHQLLATASSGARFAIEPAPMVTTTSPSRTRSITAPLISPGVSTNTGSTFPVSRTERASARPSAP